MAVSLPSRRPALNREITGAFGGNKQKVPTRTQDTLISNDYVEVILGIAEGPIKGIVPGDLPNRPVQNFFLDNTPLQNPATGVANFANFNVDFFNGEETDSPIVPKLGGVSSNLTVNVRLAQSTDVIRQTPPSMRGQIDQLEFRILFNQMVLQNDNGTFETDAQFTIAYKLSTTSTWSYYRNENVSSIRGKTTNGYVRDFIINVPRQSDADYDVRVTKMSADNSTTNVIEMTWESLQMTTIGQKNWEDLAVTHIYGQASNQFNSLPEFSGIYDGLIIKVPTNYNTETREYDETTPWDGGFKLAFTDNPSWCLYDAITNTRYGLASYYKNVAANRYEFYAAAKWCDEAVSNGKGGTQPRFTYNDVITDLRGGIEFLRYVAGSFNSVIFDDGNGMIRLKTDKYQEPRQLFTPENITKDGFNYTFTDISTRVNDVTVAFINPDTNWEEDRRAATLDTSEWKEKNGKIPEEFTAVGCIDVHEAMRRANYRILTANTEYTTVIFMTTRLGDLTEVFDSIYIADPDAGWSTGGRIKSVAGNIITLRDPIYFGDAANFTMWVQTYDGLAKLLVAPDQTGAAYSLRIVSGTLPPSLPDRTVFTVEGLASFGIAKPFKVLGIEPQDRGLYQITAIEINPTKYSDGDANTVSDPVVYSSRKPGIPDQPYNLTAASGTAYLQRGLDGTIVPRVYLSWARPFKSYIDHYEVSYQLAGSGVWEEFQVISEFAFLRNVQEGQLYNFHVVSVSPLGNRSMPVILEGHRVAGKEEPPPNVTGLLVSGGTVSWDPIPREIVPDLKGYLLRFQYGDNHDWGMATPLHMGFITDSPYPLQIHPSGPVTIMVKAIDTTDHESVMATHVLVDMGNFAVANVVQSVAFDPTFPGTLEGCSIVGGDLLANGADSFYGADTESFYGPDAEPFYKESAGYSRLTYTTDAIEITNAVEGSVTTLDVIADGASITVEYREFSNPPFYGADTDPFYGPDTMPFYRITGLAWKPWRGQAKLPNGSYQWRVSIDSSTVRGRLYSMELLVDAPDRTQIFTDLVISSSGTAVPYTLPDVSGIKSTMVTPPHANGVGAVRTEVDKTNPLAPVIFCYNSSDVAVSGAKVDIILTVF